MKVSSKKILHWAPRALGMLFPLFVAVFALDVFGRGYGFWGTALALLIHLTPSYALVAVLAIAWRWRRAGALLYAAIGLLCLFATGGRSGLASVLLIAGPPLLTAALLLLDRYCERPRASIRRFLTTAALALGVLLAGLAALAWVSTYHPRDREMVTVRHRETTPQLLKPGQRLKVMTWNVQYIAGKNHVFFYDVEGNNGPDERPTSSEVSLTIQEVARVIRDEQPDIILLQEVDHGSRRTDYRDELAELLAQLPPEYCCSATAYYHKAWFVPHPRIMGAVGMELAIVSRYRIGEAERFQLPLMPDDPVTKLFNFKRCALEARLPIAGGGEFAALSTHLDAFAQGNNTMARQVAAVIALLGSLDKQRLPWAIGGDFNLLPPGAYMRLPEDQHYLFNKDSEIEPLFQQYQSVPNLLEASGGQREQWYTQFPNDPKVKGPDRTIDYLFFSDNVNVSKHYVRQADCLRISDHFPVIAEISLPQASPAAPRGKVSDIGSSLLP